MMGYRCQIISNEVDAQPPPGYDMYFDIEY